MSLKAENPQYSFMKEDWVEATDVYDGEKAIKKKGTVYLPATAGMILDGMTNPNDIGYQAYQAYKTRALFHDFFAEGVRTLIGLLHQKEPTISLPAKMEPLRTKATSQGESLVALVRRINEGQLVRGRLGLLADFNEVNGTNDVLPYISIYSSLCAHNWDTITTEEGTELSLVVLNESGFSRNQFEWEQKEQYRVLQLIETSPGSGSYVYHQGVFKDSNFQIDQMTTPLYKGATIDFIPFLFVNSKDISSDVDNVPLKGLISLCLAIYRGEADYRQNLYMQGQETLVTVGGVSNTDTPDALQGGENSLRTGAGSRIDVEIGGDAKYIGVSANGLSEQRQALESDKALAEGKAGQMISKKNSSVESGDALRTRMAAQTATLNEIALTSAAALETMLRKIAKWIGADPEEVVVEPNLEFTDFDLAAADINILVQARKAGAPISLESIHDILKDRGITKLDFETELKKIVEENGKYKDVLEVLQGLSVIPANNSVKNNAQQA